MGQKPMLLERKWAAVPMNYLRSVLSSSLCPGVMHEDDCMTLQQKHSHWIELFDLKG